MRRLWPFGLGLVVWQLLSVGFGAGEFAYDRQPPLAALLAAMVTVAGWLVLGSWAGHHRVRRYVWFAAIFWLLVLGMLIWAKIPPLAEGDSVGPWHAALVISILLAGGPLHPLAYFLPLHDPIDATCLVAVALLAASLGSYFLTRALNAKRAA